MITVKPYNPGAKLCYADNGQAWFTTQDLDKQWGDDWDDRPYEHNAGAPYEWSGEDTGDPWEIVEIRFQGDFYAPCEGYCNSPWSVRDINSGAVAWLRPAAWVVDPKPRYFIHAGTTVEEFIRMVLGSGGRVWMEIQEG